MTYHVFEGVEYPDPNELDWDKFSHIIDPRDEVLDSLDRSHPNSTYVKYLVFGEINNFAMVELVLIDLLEAKIVREIDHGQIALTEHGLGFVTARMWQGPGWYGNFIRPDAPPLPPMGKHLRRAIQTWIHEHSDHRRSADYLKLLSDAQTH